MNQATGRLTLGNVRGNTIWVEDSIPIYTTFIMDNGDSETYDIHGTLSQQWLVEHGFISNPRKFKRGTEPESSDVEWIKQVSEITIGSGIEAIEDQALANCPSRNISLPDTITRIEARTFQECVNLWNIQIPNSVTYIGNGAFYGCRSLLQVSIPESVAEIDSYAFMRCSGMVSAKVFARVDGIPLSMFKDCGKLMALELPQEIKEIEDDAFYGCSQLRGIVLPQSLERIGDGAFHGCSNLKELVFPSSLDPRGMSGESIFDNCTELERMVFTEKTMEQVQEMEGYPWGFEDKDPDVFFQTTSHEQIPDEPTPDEPIVQNHTVVFKYVINGETNVINTIVVEHNSSISGIPSVELPGYTFNGWYTQENGHGAELTTYTKILADVEYYANLIEEKPSSENTRVVYSEESGLEDVLLDNVEFDYGTIPNVESMRGLYIGKCVQDFNYSALINAKNLKLVVIPSTFNIEYNQFQEGTGITQFVVDPENQSGKSVDGLLLSKDGKTLICGVNRNVQIPDTVETIGSDAFSGREGLTEMNIPDGVKKIESRAFRVSGLQRITFGNGIQDIGLEAFNNCKSLETVFLPPATYGSGAFQNSGLKSLTLLPGFTQVPGIFSQCKSLTSVSIPEGVTSIGWYAFYDCNSLEEITFPESLTEIQMFAFYGCKSLSSVTFLGNAPTVFHDEQYPTRNSFYGIAENAIAHVNIEKEGWPDEGTLWNDLTVKYFKPYTISEEFSRIDEEFPIDEDFSMDNVTIAQEEQGGVEEEEIPHDEYEYEDDFEDESEDAEPDNFGHESSMAGQYRDTEEDLENTLFNIIKLIRRG